VARSDARRPGGAPARWQGSAIDAGEPQASKKRAILSVAAALFRERGYERTRLDDIARALNVTKPALYYYVKNKEDILVEIQHTGLDEIMQELRALGQKDRSGADVLRRAIVRYANWVTGEFGVCVARHFLTELTPGNTARLRAAHRSVERGIRETIARGIDDGSLRRCEPWVVAAAIVGSVNWMAFWYEAGPGRRSAGEVGNAFVDLLLQGIGAPVRSAGTRVLAAGEERATP
jgi:AcrR family transcriptional regulator